MIFAHAKKIHFLKVHFQKMRCKMKRTVQEKYDYNDKLDTPFSTGYTLGVMLYRDYPRMDKEGKRLIRKIFDDNHELARSGDEIGKGVMCAVRDCANERKSRQKK